MPACPASFQIIAVHTLKKDPGQAGMTETDDMVQIC
jgi:hypothetical protein